MIVLLMMMVVMDASTGCGKEAAGSLARWPMERDFYSWCIFLKGRVSLVNSLLARAIYFFTVSEILISFTSLY